MAVSARRSDYIVAAILAVAAFCVSPLGIELATGRPDLSFRIETISLAFVLFLIAVLAAVLAQGRWRRVLFHVVAWTFPLALLAAMEAGAVAVDLSDRVAPLEDISLLANKTPWPTHLLTQSSYYTTPEGFKLYRPWHGAGVTFNALGLRTAMPTPKAPGEWRVAVTGGSATWGWRVADADTIPVRLQKILDSGGHSNVTVYNFGIGGVIFKQELALLKHFRKTYQLDEVLFYTGGNDAYLGYLGTVNRHYGNWMGTAETFELFKTAMRLQAIWSKPSPQKLQWLDREILPAVLKENTLRKGILAAAQYCRVADLRCDFVLQPMMFERKSHTGAEAVMARTLRRVYPRLDVLTERMFAAAMAAGPPGHMFDFAHIFDGTTQPFFLDHIHLDEEGYRIVAERLASIVAARLP
jgi:lysophospholipase L1-like esterase